jgi:putative Ig domain-containing protein
MRKFSPAVLSLVAATLLLPVLSQGQSVHAALLPDSASRSGISVTVTPPFAMVPSSGTVQFTALVRNTRNVAVGWSASLGTISSGGLYQAPAVSTNTKATITAVSQQDPSKSDNATVMITPSSSNPVTITTTSLPNVTVGISYSATFTAAGGKIPYFWSLTTGALPAGLTLQSSGQISGTTSQTGQFAITVQVADSSSQQQTASASFSLTVGTSGGGGGTAISRSFFDADFNGSNPWPPSDGQGQPATLAGIRLWDDGVKWSKINTSRGFYDWAAMDNWISKAQGQQMDVLYTIGSTPQFAGSIPPQSPCGPSGPYSCSSPTDINSDGTGSDSDFSAFVTALVTRYKGQISFYELWNEPDCTCFWSGTTAQIVRMGKDAAAIIRSIDPNAKILSPSAHGPSMATWFDGYVAAGGAANFDIVNVHMRGAAASNAIPETFLTIYAEVTAETAKRNLTSLPVWDDEHGIKQNQLTDPDLLAGYVARELILRASVGLQRQYEYTWDASSPYGLQGNASGTAWDQVAGWLIGHTINACVAAGTIYTCNVDDGQIVWDTAQSCSRGSCSTSNYTYPSGYVSYTDLTGTRTTLSGTTVPIGYKPIFLQAQ